MDTPKVGGNIFCLVLGSIDKSCVNEDFGVSILDPKNDSVLNLHTQHTSFYPLMWSIPIVAPQLIHFCWGETVNLC